MVALSTFLALPQRYGPCRPWCFKRVSAWRKWCQSCWLIGASVTKSFRFNWYIRKRCIYIHIYVSYIIQVEVYPTCCFLFFVGIFCFFTNTPEVVRNWTAINMIITLGELCVYNAWSDMQRSRTEGSVCWLFWVRWGRYWTCCVNGVLVEVSMSLLVCWYMDVLFLYIMKCRAVKVDEHNYYPPWN